MKKLVTVLLAAVLLLSLAGCGGSGNGGNEQAGDGALHVGMICESLGTQSFNDDVLAGLQRAQEELGIALDYIEVSEISDAANSLRTLIAQGCTFMVVPSASYRDAMVEVATEYTDVKFLYLAAAEEGYDNIMSVEYRENEGAFLGGALDNPARPFAAILGGSKVSDKIGVIENLLNKVDFLLIGGGMAYTFFKAMGYEVGSSICEADKLELAAGLIAKAKEKNVKMLLPVDTKVAAAFPDPIDAEIAVETVDADKIPSGKMGLDIGEKTQKLYAETIKGAKTVVWNGPMGVFENPVLAQGTRAVAQALADNTDAVTIIGGGDSAAAAIQMGFADKITHISTGGGASLEFLEGIELPGIACLDDK